MPAANIQKPVYELAPTTNRSAEVLAAVHGFENVAAVAESLPIEAHVLDIGAGDSLFGTEVAKIRPDINWTNFDLSYDYEPEAVERLKSMSPQNVEYIAGDVMRLSEIYGPESIDAIFSYWLFPHLSLDSHALAKKAAKQVFTVAKPDSVISIGPKAQELGFKNSLLRKPPKSQRFHRGEDMDEFADSVGNVTRLGGMTRFAQKTANEVVAPYFGTTRYSRREAGKLRFFDPVSGEYISPFSRRAAYHAGRLAIKTAQHIASRRF